MSEINGHVTNQEDPYADISEHNLKYSPDNSENLDGKTLRTASLSNNQEKGHCETSDEAMCEVRMDCDFQSNSSNVDINETAKSTNYSRIDDECFESLTYLKNVNSGDDHKNDTDSDSEDSDTDSQDSDTDSQDTETDTDTNSDENEFTKNNSGIVPIRDMNFRSNVDESESSDSSTLETDNDDIAASIAETSRTDTLENSNVPRKKKKSESTWFSEGCLEIPDISSLELNDQVQFQHMGKVQHILKEDGFLVCVLPVPNQPAYDLNTLFFLDEGKKVLGYAWDIMGQVHSPTYVFKIDERLMEGLSIEKDTKVYCIPNSKYTSLVPIDELMKERGSDASWVGDAEVPLEFADFSDDEEEQKSKKSSRQAKRKHTSLEHQKFENTMNTLNLINTQHHNSNSLNNSDKAKIIPSRQISSRLSTVENFHPRLTLNHMNRAGTRIPFPRPEWTVSSPIPSPQWRLTPPPQWPPSLHPQWTAGPPRQLTPGPPRLLTPGPPRQLTTGPPRQLTTGSPRQLTPGPHQHLTPGPPRQSTPGPSRQFTPCPPQHSTSITPQHFPPSTSKQFPSTAQQIVPFPPHIYPSGQSKQVMQGQYSVNQPPWFSPDYFLRFPSQQFITPPPQLYNVPVGIPPPGPLHGQFPHIFDPSTPPPNYGGG